jgi:hypothetical protein
MCRARVSARDAEHTVLHQVIAEHLEDFLDAVGEAGDGAGLPQFVEREFRRGARIGGNEVAGRLFDRRRSAKPGAARIRTCALAHGGPLADDGALMITEDRHGIAGLPSTRVP